MDKRRRHHRVAEKEICDCGCNCYGDGVELHLSKKQAKMIAAGFLVLITAVFAKGVLFGLWFSRD